MSIGKRKNVEDFRIRTSDEYAGDQIHSHERRIGGVLYTFSRVRWADGTVTVRAYFGRTTDVLHLWEG